MYIKELEITDFRNYEKGKIKFSEGTNIIYGKNAQGKTNILEAASIFSAGKSYRRVPDKNLIKYEKERADISVIFEVNGIEKSAEIKIEKNRKFISLCGCNLKKTSEILGTFKTVIFSPEEMMLISGAPEIRRNYIDMFLSSEKPVYYSILKKYYKILKQKNNLLKLQNTDIKDTLYVWNEEMAENAAKIMVYRKNLIDEIIPFTEKVFNEMTKGKEKFSIKYVPSVQSGIYDEDVLKDKIIEAMNKKLKAEEIMGTSIIGIHRDDIEFFINGKSAKSFASQGQQRTAIIALKIAQAELIYEKSGEYPIFLFDDVMSELDSERRSYITEKIKGKQVIITCTDRYEAENAKYFYVENGNILEE